MSTIDYRSYRLDEIAEVRSKRSRLPRHSLLRLALTDDVIEDLESRIKSAPEADLDYLKEPPILGFFQAFDFERINRFSADLDAVVARISKERVPQFTSFLRANKDEARRWYGGMYDHWVRFLALQDQPNVSFDVELDNGRDVDISLNLRGRRIHLENTVMTDDDENRDVVDRWMESMRTTGSHEVLLRPGPYCPPNAKGPSPYYQSLRLYGKVYDKVALGLDPGKSQCLPTQPNVICISLAGTHVSPRNPGYAWAIERLFAGSLDTPNRCLPDISLSTWFNHSATALVSGDDIDVRTVLKRKDAVLRARRHVSAIMLFKNGDFALSWFNHNAIAPCRLRFRELADLEEMMAEKCSYWL